MNAAALLFRSPSYRSYYTSIILHRALLHSGYTVVASSPPNPTHTSSCSPHGLNVSLHNSSLLHHHLGPFRTFQHRFCAKASDDDDDSLVASMEKKIKEQLKADEVTVKDAYGDGSHVSIEVISVAFEGQSSVNRQRMVYKAIWDELQNTVHAVDNMQTRTPAEVAKEAANK